jgi:hypothetical protein
MTRTGLALTFGLCTVLLGCSSDDAANAQFQGFPADQICGLRVELTGDITASATGNETDTECLTTTATSTQGFSVSYHPLVGAMPMFRLSVTSARKGVTGNDLPASVTLDDGMIAWVTEDCVVDFEQRFLSAGGAAGDVYRITGNGRCTSAALSSPSDSSVSVRPFEFVTAMIWWS